MYIYLYVLVYTCVSSAICYHLLHYVAIHGMNIKITFMMFIIIITLSLSYSLYPCVHISWWKDMIITSSGNGILRIYNGKSRALLIEVSAHSRWITDMDVALETGLVGLSSNIYYYSYSLVTMPCCGFSLLLARVFDKFWSMGQIGSKMVSVCAIGNTSWAN